MTRTLELGAVRTPRQRTRYGSVFIVARRSPSATPLPAVPEAAVIIHPARHTVTFLTLLLSAAAWTACGSDDSAFVGPPAGSGGSGGSTGGNGAFTGGGSAGQGGEGASAGGATGGSVGTGVCKDVACPSEGQTCVAAGDSASCQCPAGVDCGGVNACSVTPSVCDVNASCETFTGGFTCRCAPGYAGNGFTCQDVDDCALGRAACDAAHGVCVDEAGTHACECDSGFVGDGYFCKPAAEDACAPNPCQGGGSCTNTKDGFICSCPLGAAGPTCADTASCSVVTFADADLEALVRAQLDKPSGDIVPADFSGQKALFIGEDDGVSDLSGLECWTNLEQLSLVGGAVTDLTPLQHLGALRRLELSCSAVTDLSPLGGLVSLESLSLRRDFDCVAPPPLSSFGSLADLTGLRSLDVSGNRVADLSPLAGLGRLRVLVAENNQITSVSALAGLKSLETLRLSGNQIEDVEPLAVLPVPRLLALGDNGLGDVAPLGALGSLVELHLRHNEIADVSALAGLSNLLELDVAQNDIAAVAPLAELVGLTLLNLAENQVSSLEPFVSNASFGTRGRLFVMDNPLPCATEQEHIDALVTRGLDVIGECSP